VALDATMVVGARAGRGYQRMALSCGGMPIRAPRHQRCDGRRSCSGALPHARSLVQFGDRPSPLKPRRSCVGRALSRHRAIGLPSALSSPGTAVGLNLLFKMPLLPAILATSLDGLLLLLLVPRRAVRSSELLTVGLLAVVVLCLMIDLVASRPELSQVGGPRARLLPCHEGARALPKAACRLPDAADGLVAHLCAPPQLLPMAPSPSSSAPPGDGRPRAVAAARQRRHRRLNRGRQRHAPQLFPPQARRGWLGWRSVESSHPLPAMAGLARRSCPGQSSSAQLRAARPSPPGLAHKPRTLPPPPPCMHAARSSRARRAASRRRRCGTCCGSTRSTSPARWAWPSWSTSRSSSCRPPPSTKQVGARLDCPGQSGWLVGWLVGWLAHCAETCSTDPHQVTPSADA
jgi:hypothetical protein